MISLVLGNISFGGPIVRWEVWFATPFGVTSILSEAIEKCRSSDFDPEHFVKPVPVALDEKGNYEIFFSRG